jgi:hypothetical protein
MEIIKFILVIILGTIIGFGLWYLIFWFVSNEPNLFLWHPVGKIFYLMLGLASSTNIINEINDKI